MVPFQQRITCTVVDACEAIGCGKTKLWELIKSGRVQTRKIDGRTLVLVRSLLDLLQIEPTEQSEAA